MDAVIENAAEIVVQKLSESNIGIIVLTVICLGTLGTPLWKEIIKGIKQLYKKHKETKEKKEKEEREMKDNINKIATHLPEIDNQIASLTSEVSSFKALKTEWIDGYSEFIETVDDIRNTMAKISSQSEEGDNKITESINELKQTTKKIESDIGIIFEGDNDEFRLYLTQLYADHIENGKPMTREIRQTLRVKFDVYSKRGGNGWAKDLFLELMALPVESYTLPDDLH